LASEVLVPPLGQTVDIVTLVSWYKEEGDTVEKGEMLFAIETDKAILDIEAPASGVLRRVTAQAGDEVEVLSVIALIAEPDEAVYDPSPVSGFETVPLQTKLGVPKDQSAPGGSASGQRPRIFVSPRARRLAEDRGVPLEEVLATGPEGAIVERDVRTYLDAQVAATTPPEYVGTGLGWRTAPDSVANATITSRSISKAGQHGDLSESLILEKTPMRGARALIAQRLVQSSITTACVTLNSEADATELAETRCHLAKDGLDATYNALLLQILGRALRDHPRLNASLVGGSIHVWRRIDIGLAVDTERGLLVPVVRDIGRKGLSQLADESRSLVERARAGHCSPEDLSGGTFTLTDLGMFGIDSFSPIINLPECAILGVGRIKTQPVFVGNQLVPRQMMWLSLSFDHRLVDGAPAARFLQRIVQLIEHPHLLFA
jgi:pyruvate dehydrogenase E2 component (dihydrolipoamide acetyltransferase)